MEKINKHDKEIILTCVKEKINRNIKTNTEVLYNTNKPIHLQQVRNMLHENYELNKSTKNFTKAINGDNLKPD